MSLFFHLHSSPLVLKTSSASIRSPSTASKPPTSGKPANGLEIVDILDVGRERTLIYNCLQQAQKQIDWRTEVADLHTFRKALSYQAKALHFSGHGVPGHIVFENRKGEAHMVSQSELTQLLLAGRDPMLPMPLELVFLSACHSESVAQAFVAAGVKHVIVIASNDTVLDKKALSFAQAFYTALFIGRSVKESFEIGEAQADIFTSACLASSSNSFGLAAGNATFKLLGTGDHTARPFEHLQPGIVRNRTPPLPVNDCDATAECFVGRSIEVYNIYTALVEGARMITLTGMGGIGKTQIALQAAHYATERYLFQHVFFITFDLADSPNIILPRTRVEMLHFFAKYFGIAAPSSSLTVEEFAQNVRENCREGNFLVVVDGCEFIEKLPCFQWFLQIFIELIRRVRTLSFLLTNVKPFGGSKYSSERIIAIKPMPALDAARLLAVRASRKLKLDELGVPRSIEGLSMNPVLQALRGHPQSICTLGQKLQNRHLIADAEELMTRVVPEIHAQDRPTSEAAALTPLVSSLSVSSDATGDKSDPPPAPAISPMLSSTNSYGHSTLVMIAQSVEAQIKHREGAMVWAEAVLIAKTTFHTDSSGTYYPDDTLYIPFECLQQPLCRYFSTVLQGEAVQRPLSLRSLDFLRRSNQIWGNRITPESGEQTWITIPMFAVFWKWFDSLLPCLCATGFWGNKNPHLLHGFLSKAEVLKLLDACQVGTFLLRFSESRLQCITICYVRALGHIQFVQVEYDCTRGFRVAIDDTLQYFPTLAKLILQIAALEWLYPHHPKRQVFTLV